jgi:uridine kinase
MSETPRISRPELNSEHATLTFLLWGKYYELFERRLHVEHSLGDGYYCTDLLGQPITAEITTALSVAVRAVLTGDEPIELISVPRDALIARFQAAGLDDKMAVLKTHLSDSVPCIKCGDLMDYRFEPMSIDKARLQIFEIRQYAEGLILRFPMISDPYALAEWVDPRVLMQMFREFKEWAKLLQVEYVGQLNDLIYQRKIDHIKWVAEGLHDKKFSVIAEHLCANFRRKRVVTIAGPSSSNKTTFANRLAIALQVNGYDATIIGMDDFYRDACDIPFGPDGLQDFEDIAAINTELLASRVHALLDGESVPRRHFGFQSGKGKDDERERHMLGPKSFLILEGIHGLNPALLKAFGEDLVTPIYISAMTPLNIDCNHRFPTSDLRLIRRIVRDFQFRGYSPRKTLARWTSVRIGEEKHIFPYQQNAELFFNSSLVYELPVLSIYGKGLLAEATVPEKGEDPDSPQAKEITQEARRLLGMLNFFYPISLECVPHISCIREFIGGSDLKY